MPSLLKNLILILIFAGQTAYASEPSHKTHNKQPLTFASEYWPGFVDTEGNGLILNLLKQIYEPAGYVINLKVMPIKRVSLAIAIGDIEGGVGSYSAKHMNKLHLGYKPLTPKHPIGLSEVTAVCRPEHPHNWNTTKNMTKSKYAWPAGYFYDILLDIPKQKTVKDAQQGIKMLNAGRLDCFVGLIEDILEVAKTLGLPIDNFPKEVIDRKYLYFIFNDNDLGKQLVDIHDKAMLKLIESGEIYSLYNRWGQNYYRVK